MIYLYYDLDYNKYVREQLKDPINELTSKLQSQINSAYDSIYKPILELEHQISLFRNSQTLIQKQLSEITSLPDIPKVSNALKANSILNDLFHQSSTSRAIRNKITQKELEFEISETFDALDTNHDLLNEFIEFNKLYQEQVLDAAVESSLEAAQSIIKNSIYASVYASLNIMGIYVPESYRIIYNEHFKKTSHYANQTLSSAFTYFATNIMNDLFEYNVPQEIFIYLYGLLLLVSFVIDTYRYLK